MLVRLQPQARYVDSSRRGSLLDGSCEPTLEYFSFANETVAALCYFTANWDDSIGHP